jgi:hypothetical protein
VANIGVPAFSITAETLFAGLPAEWVKQQEDGYIAQRHHSTGDEYRANMDSRADARLAQFGFLLGWQASSSLLGNESEGIWLTDFPAEPS